MAFDGRDVTFCVESKKGLDDGIRAVLTVPNVTTNHEQPVYQLNHPLLYRRTNELNDGHSIQCIQRITHARHCESHSEQWQQFSVCQWPLDRLQYVFCTLWPCDLNLWPFDLIWNGQPGLMMDYPCGKFGNCSFSCFGSVVRANRRTDRPGWTLYSPDRRRE